MFIRLPMPTANTMIPSSLTASASGMVWLLFTFDLPSVITIATRGMAKICCLAPAAVVRTSSLRALRAPAVLVLALPFPGMSKYTISRIACTTCDLFVKEFSRKETLAKPLKAIAPTRVSWGPTANVFVTFSANALVIWKFLKPTLPEESRTKARSSPRAGHSAVEMRQ